MNAHPGKPVWRHTNTFGSKTGGRGNTLLAVVDVLDASTTQALWADMNGAVAIAFRDFTEEVVWDLNPDVVLTSLVSPSFDCTDVALTLTAAEFSGELRVVCELLPHPELVTTELQNTFPSLDVDLWIISPR